MMRKGRTVLQAKRYGIHSCHRQETMLQAAQAMMDKEVNTIVVVDEEGYLAGIMTRTDLIRAYLDREDWGTHSVEAYMSREVVTVTPQTMLSDVAKILLDNRIRQVVVVQHEQGRSRPLAVLSTGDLVYHMVQEVE